MLARVLAMVQELEGFLGMEGEGEGEVEAAVAVVMVNN